MNFDLPTILGVVTLLSVLFAIYSYFRNPQEKLDKDSSMLAQQVQWEKELSESRFKDMGARLDTALTLAQNHTHTVDVKVDNLTAVVTGMNLQLTGEIIKLATIINERIPKKINL